MKEMIRKRFLRVPRLRTIQGIFCVAVSVGLWAVLPVHADTVWLNMDTAPIHGRITQITADSIVLESTVEPGKSDTILRSGVLAWHRSIDTERLESLRPESPGGYLQFAEELAGLRFDPAAMELSRQLALIAMHLDFDRNGTGTLPSPVAMQSLNLLLGLEADDLQRQKLIRLGIVMGLLDSSTKTIAGPENAAPNRSMPEKEGSRFLLAQIRKIRRGEFQPAAIDQLFGPLNGSLRDWELMMTAQELQDCIAATALSATQKLQIVRLEIAITDYLENGRLPGIDSNWATASRLPAIRAPQAISTRNVSDFDPERCLWQNGQWTSKGQ